MVNEGNFPSGAMQTPTTTNNGTTTTSTTTSGGRIRSINSSFNTEDEDCGGNNTGGDRNRSDSLISSYLILSPSNPIRIFAISFLTHWIYPTVIVLSICAFVISSVHCTFYSYKRKVGLDEVEEIIKEKCTSLEVTRWVLFITLLSEIFIKSIARGFFIGSKLAYLRIIWDWMDVVSLFFIFLSIIIPWKTVEFTSAAVVLLKLIPIHPGSINAFIFLFSCAKKLIPVLLYGLIIVWIYGFIIFTLFVKYHPEEELFVDEHNPSKWIHFGVPKSNGSTSDTVKANITSLGSSTAGFVDGSPYQLPPSPPPPTTERKSQNFSHGLSMECLPTSFRSLSGSFIQATEMLTLRYSVSNISKAPSSTSSSGTNALSLNETSEKESWSCQYETYALSIIETLVIISGTLPMTIMSFSTLSHFFRKMRGEKSRQNSVYEGVRETTSYSTPNNENHTGPAIKCFHVISNLLCDCDYYFCCLGNLQRRLSPFASGILNSKKFKVFIILIVSTDFLCMVHLLWFAKTESTLTIDFPTLSLIIYYYIQICFVVYTIEAVFRWLAISSDEYWMTIWSAFDLTVVIIYWIGLTVLHVRNCQIYYFPFCGILMFRMLKLVPYWSSMENSLKLVSLSVLRNRENLFVILLCSCSCVLVKYAVFMLEDRWGSHLFPGDLISALPLDFYTFVESSFRLVFYFLSCIIVVIIYITIYDNLKTHQRPGSIRLPDTTRNPSISLLLSSSHELHDVSFDELGNIDPHRFTESRRSFNESSSPISVMSMPNGIGHNKYRFASSPTGSSNNGMLLSTGTRSTILTPSSDVLSPLLSLPVPNGLNGHAHHHHSGVNSSDEQEESFLHGVRRNEVRRDSFFYPARPISTEDVVNFLTAAIVILACMNLAIDSSGNETNMSWRSLYPGRSLWLELIFIFSITLHLIYKTRLSRFSRETFMQITTVIDLIVILAAAVEMFSSGMKWVPTTGDNGALVIFEECAKIISASRGLLLLSRVSWLQCIGSGLCYLVWKVIRYVTAFGYLWTVFIIASTETQKMIQILLKGNPETNITLPDFSNGTSIDRPQEEIQAKDNMTLHPILLTVTMFLFLLSIAAFLGYLRYRFENLTQLTQKFMTKSQVKSQQHSDTTRCQSNFHEYSGVTGPQEIQPTKGICIPMMYFVTNHRTFDIIVMAVIFLDGLGITLEHFGTSERALVLRKHYPAYMIFLYIFEIASKLIGNGLSFFKSYWNIFDCVIITVSTIDFFTSLISQNWIPLLVQNVRFFRILRIFQFYPFVQRTEIIQQFFHSIPLLAYPIWNFTFFYFCVHIAAISYLIRCSHFIIQTHSVLFWPGVAAPFENLNFVSIFETLGNHSFSTYIFQRLFYEGGVTLFSLIKIAVLFTIGFILTVNLNQYLTEQELIQARKHSSRIIQSRHHNGDEVEEHDRLDYEDKPTFTMPCISPETIDIETPSSAGTSSRLANHSSSNLEGPIMRCKDSTEDFDRPNSLYKTTTITSTEEINGCKVFFVEAMITTV